MTTKLTLTLDKDVIERTKKYAKENETSLSRMVEGYFEKVTSCDIRELVPEYSVSSLPPITASLVGIGKGKGKEFLEDDKDALYEALKEKYL